MNDQSQWKQSRAFVLVYFHRRTDYVMSDSRGSREQRMHGRSLRNRDDRGNKEITSVISVASCSINPRTRGACCPLDGSVICRQNREVILEPFLMNHRPSHPERLFSFVVVANDPRPDRIGRSRSLISRFRQRRGRWFDRSVGTQRND